MTNFNPENKEELTYGECLDPAMEIKSKKDAEQYFKNYVVYIQKFLDKEPRDDDKTAEDIAKINIGYWSGYYDIKTQKRIEKLFMCKHPIFGKINENK